MTFIDRYFWLWNLVLPISSVVLFPTIKGTTPGYLFSLLAISFMFWPFHPRVRIYIKMFVTISIIFVVLNLISQLLLLVLNSNISLSNLRLIDTTDSTLIFRNSMFTQSIYFIAGLSTLCFVKAFYNYRWESFLFNGALMLAVYGLYEFLYFLIFHTNGDFLSNRVLGLGEEGTSSLFEIFRMGSFEMQRFKSLTGEPSMYAFTIWPFCIYALHTKKYVIHIVLFVTLLLTTSTSAILGLVVYIVGRFFIYGWRDRYFLVCCSILTLVIIFGGDIVSQLFNQIIFQKISMEDFSGMDRMDSFSTTIAFYMDLDIVNQLFGIGFGYVRSTDMLTTLLVNSGIVGFFMFTMLFVYPLIKLDNSERSRGIKLGLLVIYVLMMIAVAEYSYLSVWLFLGIAYYYTESRSKVQLC